MDSRARADLERSGISPADAELAALFDVADASTIYPDFKTLPALVLPYHAPDGALMTFQRDGETLPFCRVRYLEEPSAPRGFIPQKTQRYGQPKASGCRAYFPPVIDWPAILADPAQPLVITEGEKKTLAAVLAGFNVIGLGGVFNFMEHTESLLPELDAIIWERRDVYICFDSDAVLNPNILAAEARLVDELQRKRGARCFLARLPQEGEHKVGLDDYLLAHGPDKLAGLLQQAPSLGALDAKVVALNKSVAWIEREGLVYDLETGLFLPKDHFCSGSRFSSLEHITVGGKKRTEPRRISVARTWLTHPHAQRFSEVLFRPGEGPTVEGENGGTALNIWTGWHAGHGDVAPWLRLTDFILSDSEPEVQDIVVKLLAYKAQNPAEKVPLALVLIGPQGSGKSLWSNCVHDAFAPYATTISGKSFDSEFQGWLEKSLLAVIHEAEAEAMQRGKHVLKALISDLRRPMNEKYRPARQINSYTFYILTANNRAVGAFERDDRRMVIVGCPRPRDKAFYEEVVAWREAGGPQALLGYLLDYDLQGWTPPQSAPMTAEKHMAYMESLSPVERLAEDMRTATENTIKLWLDQATEWARRAEGGVNTHHAGMARATLDAVSQFQIRPWYTPEELTLIFPSIASHLQGARGDMRTTPGRLSQELRNAGVPYLRCADSPRGFVWQGLSRQYLVVADFEEWRTPLRQDEFERQMRQWPRYQARR